MLILLCDCGHTSVKSTFIKLFSNYSSGLCHPSPSVTLMIRGIVKEKILVSLYKLRFLLGQRRSRNIYTYSFVLSPADLHFPHQVCMFVCYNSHKIYYAVSAFSHSATFWKLIKKMQQHLL